MYVYIYIHTYMCIYIYTYVCICVCVCVYIYICDHIYMIYIYIKIYFNISLFSKWYILKLSQNKSWKKWFIWELAPLKTILGESRYFDTGLLYRTGGTMGTRLEGSLSWTGFVFLFDLGIPVDLSFPGASSCNSLDKHITVLQVKLHNMGQVLC